MLTALEQLDAARPPEIYSQVRANNRRAKIKPQSAYSSASNALLNVRLEQLVETNEVRNGRPYRHGKHELTAKGRQFLMDHRYLYEEHNK